MRFLFPGFLFALLAIAIPVIIHLFNFRKFRTVYFSNVRFLKSIDQQTASRRNLKNLLVLAARVLAITFLVLAFARPYISNDKSAGTSRRVASIYIDNSYSMEGVNREGTLLDEARRRAKEIAAEYSLNDKFQLLTNDFEGKHQRLLSYEDFLNAVEDIRISSATRDISQVIARQNDIFASEPEAGKSIFLISDFQQNLLQTKNIRVDSTVAVNLVRLKSNPLPNVSVDSVWLISAIQKPGEAGRVVARLRNNSDREAQNIPLRLSLNGQQKAIGNVSIAPRATQNDTLSFSGLNAGWKAGEISIQDYPVVFDDRFYFSFNVLPHLRILAINGAAANPYLQAVYRSDNYFILENSSAGNINYSGLGDHSLVILNEIPEFSSGLIQQLKSFTERGGNLLILPALEADPSALTALLRALDTDTPREVITGEIRVSAINLQHPVFKDVFETVPQRIDLPAVKSYLRYTSQNQTNRQSLLSLPGRQEFLSEYRLGKGRIFLSAVPLTEEASNFVRHSLFVPVMYQIALLSSQPQRLYSVLGRDQAVEIQSTSLKANQTLTLRKDKFEAIPDLRRSGNITQLYVADQIKDSGTYELLKGDSLLSYVAFNQSGNESDLSYASDQELNSALPGANIRIINSADGAVKSAVESANLGLQLWKLCIILALFCLAAEILLLRFYKVQTARAEVYEAL
ncbi:hypothetical protein GZH53_08795 [Flavihumibacter sp. R14]|nr:hypothetical protein [Flavihumibacter soli]